jgi:hypothetical protein
MRHGLISPEKPLSVWARFDHFGVGWPSYCSAEPLFAPFSPHREASLSFLNAGGRLTPFPAVRQRLNTFSGFNRF